MKLSKAVAGGAVLGLLALVGVSGCGGTTTPIDAHTGPRTMIGASYQAADVIISAMGGALDPAKPVLVTSLADEENLDESSPFGRLLAEQVASRLITAGYSVHEVKFGEVLSVARGRGEFVLSREADRIAVSAGAQAVLAGTYTTAANQVFVNLKLIRADDGRVMAAHDFIVPMDENVRVLVRQKQVLTY